jgi:hypothetical protein
MVGLDMKVCYVDKNFGAKSLAIIDNADAIIKEYAEQGYLLTLRQLYYQFVARDLIENRQSEYKRLGSIIADARLAGLLDWDAIEDRGRNINIPPSWSDPASIIKVCAEQYRLDLWEDQSFRPEVWVEKEALLSVMQVACDKYRVPYFACKGYVSQSEMWNAGAKRLRKHISNGQVPFIIHLGDHDPSGIDMTRDISDRLELFAGGSVEVKRIALNFHQIGQYNPPPNPAKITDSRFAKYASCYGTESWELDALQPNVLVSLIQKKILSRLDGDKWDVLKEQETEERKHLMDISDNYELVVKTLLGEK